MLAYISKHIKSVYIIAVHTSPFASCSVFGSVAGMATQILCNILHAFCIYLSVAFVVAHCHFSHFKPFPFSELLLYETANICIIFVFVVHVNGARISDERKKHASD